MKIVHIITRMIIGGAQENTLLTCLGQLAGGHEVTLLSGPTRGPEGSLVARARAAAGLRFEELPDLLRPIAPLRDLRAERAIQRRLAELRPDVVHTHSSKAGILGRRAAARLRSRPIIVHTIHGLPFHPYQNALVRAAYIWAERHAARRCDRIISVADAMTEQAVAARVAPAEKFVTVYSGMEVEPFLHPTEPVARVRQRYRLPAEAVVVIKIARLFHLKGHADVLRAFAEVAGRHPTAYLLFVGDGVLRSRIERLARDLGVADRLRFTGLVTPEEIAPLIHAADLLVHASLREGLARVLPQALLSGRPVVSYDVDGAREVVRSGETGLLVAPRDWRGLARAMDTLLSDRMLRARLGQSGRRLCLERFDHRLMVERIAEVYAAVAGRR